MATLGKKKRCKLPHKSWGEPNLAAIQEGICVAWEALKSKEISFLSSAEEEEITAKLESEIFQVMQRGLIPRFNADIFQNISRGSKWPDYTGKRIEKAPDFQLRRQNCKTGLNREYTDILHIECKLVDAVMGRDYRDYITGGIARFVKGEYGWTMPHAIMLAYVRNDNDCLGTISRRFERNGEKPAYKECLPLTGFSLGLLSDTSTQNYRTLHSRTWRYQPKRELPGSIELHHIWLSASV